MERIDLRLFLLRGSKSGKAWKHKGMKSQETKERLAEIKAKLKESQELLDSLENVDENDIEVQSETLLTIARLHKEVADAVAELDRLHGISSRK